MTVKRSISKIITVGLALASLLPPSALATTQIRYGIWDSAQIPPYRACADLFQSENPDIKIVIDQIGWNDYWTTLTTQMVTGEAYDVFWNHVSRFPQLAEEGQLVDIGPLVARDNVDLSIYRPVNLVGEWVRDGARYGIPKDVGMDGVFYNPEMLAKAGIDSKVAGTWTWNPKDGGTFEATIAALTIDQNGKNGLSPDFEKTKVVQYGFATAMVEWSGQSSWADLAASTGFKLQDKPFAGKFNYEDPRFLATLDWWKSMIVKGYAPPLEDLAKGGLGSEALFQAGKVAVLLNGNWNIETLRHAPFKLAIGRLPAGPEGIRPMANGLADSIYINSQHKEEAWKWMKFLASPVCAEIVGKSGVVIPAQQGPAQMVADFYKAHDLDLAPFIEPPSGGSFTPYPIDFKVAEVSAIVDPLLEDYVGGRIDATTFLERIKEVNALYN